MASHFPKTQIQEFPNGYGSKESAEKNIEFGFGHSFHNSLAVDYLFLVPAPFRPRVPFQSPFLQWQPISDNEIAHGCPLKATNGRCFTQMATTKEEKSIILDLNLSLSPPGLLHSPSKSLRQSETSQGSCKTLKVNSSEDSSPNPTTIEEPSLILMGCKCCLIYVMVSGANPKCPKCKGWSLIDVFR